MLVPKTKIAETAQALISCGAKEVYVFGSAACDKMTPDSDMDFAVSGLPASNFYLAVAKALEAAGGPIDVVELGDDTPFTRNLIRRGKLVRVG